MGACTFTASPDAYSPSDSNLGWTVNGSITLSNSYATGGDTLTAAQLGLGTIKGIQISPASGYVFAYNSGTGKVQAYETGAALSGVLAEAANGTNLSAISAGVEAWG